MVSYRAGKCSRSTQYADSSMKLNGLMWFKGKLKLDDAYHLYRMGTTFNVNDVKLHVT